MNVLLHKNKTMITPSEFNIDTNPVSFYGQSSGFSSYPDYVLSCFDGGPNQGPSPSVGSPRSLIWSLPPACFVFCDTDIYLFVWQNAPQCGLTDGSL